MTDTPHVSPYLLREPVTEREDGLLKAVREYLALVDDAFSSSHDILATDMQNVRMKFRRALAAYDTGSKP